MNMNSYPTSSGNLVVKQVGDSFIVKDMLSKKSGHANESLKSLLLQCDGKRTIRDIIDSLTKKYEDDAKEIERKAIKSLKYLESLDFLKLADKPSFTPIMFHSKKLRWPLNLVYIEVTRACNLSCIHCYASAGKEPENELDTGQLHALIDQLSSLGVLDVVFTGGEPLMRSDIFELMEHATKKSMSPYLFTNGVLLNENRIRRLKELNVETVAVSLDGASPKTHNKIRGSDCFDVTLRNIQQLAKTEIHTRINTALYRDNIDEIEKLIELLARIGVNEIQMDCLMGYGRGEALKDLILPLETSEEITYRIHKKNKEFETKQKTRVPELRMSDSTSTQSVKVKRQSLCGVGTTACAIRPNGDVVLCPVLSTDEFVAGNVLEDSLESIWINSEVFDPLRSQDVNSISQCSKCNHKDYCLGGCKAKAYFFNKRFDASDPWMCFGFKGYEKWKQSDQA